MDFPVGGYDAEKFPHHNHKKNLIHRGVLHPSAFIYGRGRFPKSGNSPLAEQLLREKEKGCLLCGYATKQADYVPTTIPPSTRSVSPVIKEASSDARKR